MKRAALPSLVVLASSLTLQSCTQGKVADSYAQTAKPKEEMKVTAQATAADDKIATDMATKKATTEFKKRFPDYKGPLEMALAGGSNSDGTTTISVTVCPP